MKNKTTAGIIVVSLGVLIAIIPQAIFPVCTDKIELLNGKSLFMKCHWTAMTELLIGMLIVFDGILLIIFKKTETCIVLNIMLFLLGFTALLLPTTVIGMCESPAMPCGIGTEPALIVVSIIIMIFGLGNVFSQISSLKDEKLHEERSVVK
jgi:hypothetical protein